MSTPEIVALALVFVLGGTGVALLLGGVIALVADDTKTQESPGVAQTLDILVLGGLWGAFVASVSNWGIRPQARYLIYAGIVLVGCAVLLVKGGFQMVDGFNNQNNSDANNAMEHTEVPRHDGCGKE